MYACLAHNRVGPFPLMMPSRCNNGTQLARAAQLQRMIARALASAMGSARAASASALQAADVRGVPYVGGCGYCRQFHKRPVLLRMDPAGMPEHALPGCPGCGGPGLWLLPIRGQLPGFGHTPKYQHLGKGHIPRRWNTGREEHRGTCLLSGVASESSWQGVRASGRADE